MENIQATKLTRSILGTDEDRQHFIMNGKSAEEILKAEAIGKYNTAVDEYAEKLEEQNKRVREAAEQIVTKADDMEILPINNNLIVQPFAENPFQTIKATSSGFIYDLGGKAPEYKSNETGEIKEEEQFIKVANVVAVGPTCTYIKEGDIIMYTKPSQVPLPFFKEGFHVVPEGRVMAVINEGLTERFKNIK